MTRIIDRDIDFYTAEIETVTGMIRQAPESDVSRLARRRIHARRVLRALQDYRTFLDTPEDKP